MAAALDYAQLDGKDVVARFRRDGSVDIRVPERHATACAQLVDVCRTIQQHRGTRQSLFSIVRLSSAASACSYALASSIRS
jgi:hypothetical protein